MADTNNFCPGNITNISINEIFWCSHNFLLVGVAYLFSFSLQPLRRYTFSQIEPVWELPEFLRYPGNRLYWFWAEMVIVIFHKCSQLHVNQIQCCQGYQLKLQLIFTITSLLQFSISIKQLQFLDSENHLVQLHFFDQLQFQKLLTKIHLQFCG